MENPFYTKLRTMLMVSLRQSTMKVWLLFAVLLVPQLLLAQTAVQPAQGDGTKENPYQITSAEELAWFRDEVNAGNNTACAVLMDNIDMSSVCHATSDGQDELSWNPISPEGVGWSGTFDGNGKILSNLYINVEDYCLGLFGDVKDGVIKNLDMSQVNISSNTNFVGVLVGYAENTKIQNIKTDALCFISAYNRAGGIAGKTQNCQIENCENRATVNAWDEVGGICGSSSGLIRGCSNYGKVKGNREEVGGISGSVSYLNDCIFEDCANYAEIQGSEEVGGLVGKFYGELKNCFSCGDVAGKSSSTGLLVGCKYGSITGLVVYDTDAILNGSANPNLIGAGKGNPDLTKGFSRDFLKKGMATFLLQQNASEGVTWGQNLIEDAYPVLGSCYKVYADGETAYTCTGEMIGTLTNSFSEEGNVKMVHTSVTHHEGVAVTCLVDGMAEYYECNECHEYYKDEAMTNKITDVKIVASGHDYYGESDTCTKCGLVIPELKLGENNIQISRVCVDGPNSKINSYSSIFKFVATRDGTFNVSAKFYSSFKRYWLGIWDSSKSRNLKWIEWSFVFAGTGPSNMMFNITNGETYYICVREEYGNAIEEEQTLTLKVNGMTEDLPAGAGTEDSPYELYNANDLAWYRDQVNAGNKTACAKLMADIDMSSVCHAASDDQEELNWEPISSKSVEWGGTFDGNGKTISNLYYNNHGVDFVYGGLFGYASGTFKDLTFENSKIKVKGTYNYGGILVAFANQATIKNVATGAACSIIGAYVGGIAGYLQESQIQDCINRATVSGTYNLGGICAQFSAKSAKSVNGCINLGSVTGTSSSLGGILGILASGKVENCANYALVKGIDSGSSVGGIAGYCDGGTVENCANYANIQGSYGIGGIVGEVYGTVDFTLKNVFTNGDVAGFRSCGLVLGWNRRTSVTGLVAYNSEAVLMIDDIQQEPKALPDDYPLVSGEEYLQPFTEDEIASGKVAYLLNNGVMDGTQAWYQKLGEDGDAYPVLTPAESSIVYRMEGYNCDGTRKEDFVPSYNNEGITRYDEPHNYQEKQLLQGLYTMACSKCDANESDKRTIKNFTGEGKNLEVTDVDGTYQVEQLTLTDAEPYYSPVDVVVENLDYHRNFSGMAGKWQTLYVPFAFDCDDLAEDYEVAAINNFHEFEQKNGDTKVVLEVRKLTSGTLQPLTPYLIRLKEGASDPLSLSVFKESNKEFTLVPSESRYTDCSSVTRYYKFTGVLQAKEGFVDTQDFVMNGGILYKAAADARLNPQRWYLSATDRSGNSSAVEQLVRLKSISINVVEEGAITGIEDIYVTTDIEGVQSSRQGIYDLQGRKLSQEPISGVYIKDGKKYVK